MNGTQSTMGWGSRLLVALSLILVGAGAAVWGLGHYRPAARLLGLAPPIIPPPAASPKATVLNPPVTQVGAELADEERIASLERRISKVENATERAEGSAGRADGLVVAFAARRAIDRGVALGYLEPLLNQRFGGQHPAAVATIITAARQPVRLNELIDEYAALGPDLRRGGPQDSWWTSFKRELGSLAEVHRVDQPAVNAQARYARASQRLQTGDVDQALAETMRLPRCRKRRNLDREGEALRRGPPGTRRNRIGGAASRTRHCGDPGCLSIKICGRLEVMASTCGRIRTGVRVAVAVGGIAFSAASLSAADLARPATRAHATATAPDYIQERIRALGQNFDGRVGIAVRSVDDGWSVGWKSDELYPQQSVSKLWVAITALDEVDKGKLALDQGVTLTRDDLTLFHQPIAQEILAGPLTTTVGDLLVRAITTSDNTGQRQAHAHRRRTRCSAQDDQD